MATIRTAIQIQDGMSHAFQSMNTAMNVVLSSFESLQTASGNAIDTASIQMARQELMRAESAFNDIEQEINQSAEAQRRFNGDIRNGQSDVDGLVSKFRNLAITVGSIFAVGSVIKGGFDRLINIDTANAKLQALGHNSQSVEVIMNDALNSVRGTAFGLDEAVNTAASAVAAGVRPGQQLERYLSLTADAAAIAGTNMNEMGAIFNKVTTSGKIQAQELNQISDRGIPIFQMLADEIGVTAQEIRALASDGKISSKIFLNAVESGFGGAAQAMGTASFQATLDNIGASINRIGANFLNGAGDGQGFFDQVKPLMVDLLNTLSNFEDRVVIVGEMFGRAFSYIYDIASTVVGFFVDYWSIIAPVVGGTITALLIYTTALIGVKTALMIASSWQAIMAARATLLTGATFAQTAAQHGLNAAMMASPITWIIMAVIILIALFYAAIGAINHFAGTSISATGIIAGSFMVLATAIYNVIAYLWNIFAAIAEFFVNVWRHPMYSVKKLFANLAINFLDQALSMTQGWDGFATAFVNAIISAVNGAIRAWNWFIDLLPDSVASTLGLGKGTEFTHRTSITSDLSNLKRGIELSVGDAPDDYWEAPKMDAKSLSGAWDMGYEWGANLLGGKDSDAGASIDNGMQSLLDGLQDLDGPLSDAADKGGKTAGNTAKMAKVMEGSEEDLKYLRDIAERDVINRFTTAEIKVDFKSENTINSDLDLDGIIDQFAEKLEEAIDVAAEGAK